MEINDHTTRGAYIWVILTVVSYEEVRNVVAVSHGGGGVCLIFRKSRRAPFWLSVEVEPTTRHFIATNPEFGSATWLGV